MANISKEKLRDKFRPFNALDMSYVRLGEKIAKQYINNEPIDQGELENVRCWACEDRMHLKGDFVISLFVNLYEPKAKFNRWNKGKTMKISKRLLCKIFANHFSKELSVTEFCTKNRITRTKYYRVINCNVKNQSDKEYLEFVRCKAEKIYSEETQAVNINQSDIEQGLL